MRYIIRLYVRLMKRLRGRSYVLSRLNAWGVWLGEAEILEFLGARIGQGIHIEPGIRIQNARDGACDNLQLGSHVYVGPECLFDLACPIAIEDEVVLSARVCLVTHADVGNRPLKRRYPRREGAIVVKRGAWIGMNVVVLHGVTIGECAVVGAMSLVRRDVPPHSLSMGIPARTIKQFDDALSRGERVSGGA